MKDKRVMLRITFRHHADGLQLSVPEAEGQRVIKAWKDGGVRIGGYIPEEDFTWEVYLDEVICIIMINQAVLAERQKAMAQLQQQQETQKPIVNYAQPGWPGGWKGMS